MVDDFEFYPHTCVIYRGSTENYCTGKSTPNEIFRGECYLQEGNTRLQGDWLQGEDRVFISDKDIVIMEGDRIEVTLENNSVYSGIVKQAYPVNDDDFGGQDLKVFKRNAS